jgi:hypothetical protein
LAIGRFSVEVLCNTEVQLVCLFVVASLISDSLGVYDLCNEVKSKKDEFAKRGSVFACMKLSSF